MFRKRWFGALLVLVLAVVGGAVLRRFSANPGRSADAVGASRKAPSPAASGSELDRSARAAFARSGGQSSEAIVAGRLTVFGRKRRDTAHRLAEQRGVQVPVEVERFFDAVEAGDWVKIQELYEMLHARRRASDPQDSPGLEAVWHAVHETLGVAEVAFTWPAKALIEYGQAILNTVPPGTVYLGGTDAGRFAPSLFNDVGGTDGRILLTQNALADVSYLEYVNLLHGSRLESISAEESGRVFSQYLEDALRRARHDADYPEEPRQVRPGEVINTATEGRVQVSGQTAVMAINEGLVQLLLAKNPGQRFALEEAFPLKSLYPDALPAGPLLELRAGGSDPAMVQERAQASAEFWRALAGSVAADGPGVTDSRSRSAWADLAAAQGSYFAAHELPTLAEETWRRALEIGPDNQKAMFLLVEQLMRGERRNEAIQVVDRFLQANPSAPPTITALRGQLIGAPNWR